MGRDFRRAIAVWILVAIIGSAFAYVRLWPERTSAPPEVARSSTRPAGPGTTEPGILLVVTPTADATFNVTELVMLSASTTSITVRPPAVSAAGSAFASARPFASKVRITTRDGAVPVSDGIVNRAQTFTVDEPVRRYQMRYELNRAIVRSRPSNAGRALGVIRPLTSAVPDHLTVAVLATGVGVRNLSCPVLASSLESCVAGKPPLLHLRWDLPWRSAVVVVQLDLPDT